MENQPLDAIAPTPISEVPSEYIVSKGDTLSEIAARGGLDLDRLIDFNNLKNSNIFVGQKIRFPSDGYEISNETESESDMPSEYTVSRGDTLSEIAVKQSEWLFFMLFNTPTTLAAQKPYISANRKITISRS